MEQKGFPYNFLKWVAGCINYIPFSIMLNGDIKGYLSSANGLWQGCPLSSLLFTIDMNSFSCLIEKEINLFNYQPFFGYRNMFYLLFADDLIVTWVVEQKYY